MKIKPFTVGPLIILVLTLLLVLAIVCNAGTCDAACDYAHFETWMLHVRNVAPRFNLKLDGNEAEDEFFYLYCWQSNDHSIVHAIRYAKKVWGEQSK